MTTEEWYDGVTGALLAESPFRRSEYFTSCQSSRAFAALTHDVPRSAALCATALLEEEVVEIARTVDRGLVQHYGVRPDWGAANYTVHEAIEQEESGETKKTILGHLETAEDRRAAEAAMRAMHELLVAYADGLARRYPA